MNTPDQSCRGGEDILATLEDGILTLAINRPGQFNSMGQGTGRRLHERVRDASMDPDVRVLIVTGKGKSFCVGADVKNMGAVDPEDRLAAKWGKDPAWNDLEMRTARLIRSLETPKLLHCMPKPTIAMVRGAAAGAGLGLALCCDFRIASDNAYFTTAFARIGASGDYGGSYFMTHLVGAAKTRELYFFSDRIDAAEALRIGLVNRVVPDAELEEQTMVFARRLAAGPPIAYGFMKQNLNKAETERLDDVFEIEARNMIRSFQTEDAREAMQAFRDRRDPSFKGR